MPILTERERGRMKKHTSKFLLFFAGAVFILLFFAANPIRAMADELYFDDEGNLYFVTRDKKASGSVRYMTIGWVIKRYDMPMNVPGQQYVIVTKTNYKPDEPDPTDSRYVYTYFKSDKDEILGAVKSVSNEWYDILVNYGDTVYIDSVMTVVNGDRQLGYLYPGGAHTGEVYFTYDGIAGARDWASKSGIRAYFDMAVTFHAIVEGREPDEEVVGEDTIIISSSVCASFQNGSRSYDITAGIPSGESMYLEGYADMGKYTITCRRVTAEYSVDVVVPVTYILKWTDYEGVAREEEKQVNYKYTVKRQFQYYTFENAEKYMLSEVILRGGVTGGEYRIPVNTGGQNDVMDGTVVYGDVSNHIMGCNMHSVTNADTIVVTGSDYLKPSIPDADYSGVAESLVGDVKVRSDRVVVGGNVIMSDDVKNKSGASPEGAIVGEAVYVNEEDIYIPKNTRNGNYRVDISLLYKNESGDIYTYTGSGLRSVTVHTPVVCDGTAGARKTLNQAVEPKSYDIVLGEPFRISFNDFGMHRNIMGYGLKSYGKYVGIRQVCCPFDVIYKGIRYEEGKWITLGSYSDELILCEDNREGEYQIRIRTLAYNADYITDDGVIQENANTDRDKYGAGRNINVRVIGKLCNLRVYDGEEESRAENMPVAAGLVSYETDESDIKSEFDIHIATVGDIGDGDYLRVKYDYFYEGVDGSLMPVEVYEVANRDQIDYETLNKFVEDDIWSGDICQLSGNKGEWIKTYTFPREFIVVPEETTAEDIKEAAREDKVNELILNGGSLIVTADIVRYKDGAAFLDYINGENSKKGYCNMWLKEGGSTVYGYGAIIKYGLPGKDYYDYEVKGTH